MQHKEISTFHVILLFMMCTGLLNHVIIIPPLLDAAGRDAWISVLFSFIVFLIWALLIYYIIRATKQQNLYMWLKINIGKPVTYFLVGCITFYLLVSITITLKDLVLWTYITYLPRTPQIIITAAFLILCLLMANTSIRTIAIVNGILLPIVVILGFFVMSANFSKKDYSLLTPLFEFGYTPTLQGMVYVCSGLIEVIIILFIQHHVKTRINYFSLAVIGALLVWLTLGPTMGSIATFGPAKASELRFPAFEQWALVSLSRFIEHVDFLSIYQWLSGAFVRISLGLFIIIDFLQLSRKKRTKLLLTCGLVLAGINLLPINDMQFILFLAKYLLPGLLIFALSLSLIIGLLVFICKRRTYQHGA